MRKRSKVLTLIIMLSMLISSVSTVYAQVSDVEKHWAKEEISYMLDKGFLTGYPDGTFRPEDNVSKAEFYRIINNLMGYAEKAEFRFKDVKSEDWFYNDVAKGIKAGYLVDAEFLNPRDFITREEVARIIGVTFKLSENVESTTYFKDYTLISPSAAGFIGTLKDEGYIAGFPDGNFGPLNNIKRSEVVKMLYNVLMAEGIPQKADLTAYNAALAKVKQSDYTKESWTAYQKVVLANVVTEKNSQEEVKAATAAIIAAQNKLVKPTSGGTVYVPTNPTQKADLTAYNAALAAVKQSEYTEESWAAYQEVVLANAVTENNTQARVNEATAAITAAQKNLVKIEVPVDPVVDKTALVAKIAEVQGLNSEEYTEESWENLQTVLAEAIAVKENAEATQEQVDSATTTIIAAQNKLVKKEEPVEVEKTDLIAKIAEVQGLNSEEYTEESWENLQTVLAEAIAVKENVEATKEQVDSAFVALKAAIEALEVKPIESSITNIMPNEDITLSSGETLTVSFNAPEGGDAYFRILLSEQTPMRNMDGISINSNNYKKIMEEVSPGLYSASWTVYDGVIGSWEIEVNFESKEGVKLSEIAEGIINIVKKPVVPVVDKSALETAIEQAQTKNEADYTEESWIPFSQALSSAISVNNDEESTQAEVNSALANLTATMNALVEKDRPSPIIIATFHKSFMPTFGNVSVQVQNIERAAKFDVVYHLSNNPDGSENIKQTQIVDISQRTELIFYDPSQHNTITIRIYDMNNKLIYTFEDVLPVMGK